MLHAPIKNSFFDPVEIIRIPNPETGGFVMIGHGQDFEYRNPVTQMHDTFITHRMALEQNILILKKTPYPLHLFDQLLRRRAEEQWPERLKEMTSVPAPQELINLLESDSKKEQIKLLNRLDLTTAELIAFILKAGEKHQFVFSQYHSEHYPNGTEKNKLPTLFYKPEGGEMTAIGLTNLSTGQLNNLVLQRSVIVAKFLDKGDRWHCFFLTYRSIAGRESYKRGQPHLHYISNFWGIPREEVVKQLKSKNYSLPSLPHIDYHTHRNPRKD